MPLIHYNLPDGGHVVEANEAFFPAPVVAWLYNETDSHIFVGQVPWPGQPYHPGITGPSPTLVYPNYVGQPPAAPPAPGTTTVLANPAEIDSFDIGAPQTIDNYGAQALVPKKTNGSNASLNKPFFIIYDPTSDTRRRYGVEETAKGDAEKMAKKNPGRDYVICKAVGKVSTENPVPKHEDYEENGS